MADEFYPKLLMKSFSIDGTKTVLANIYAPNDATQQVICFRDLSKEFLSPCANDNLSRARR